jgi:hypothetical protein
MIIMAKQNSEQFDSHSKDYRLDPPAPYQSESANLRGWPGYRTRPGEFGLNLIDSAAESAHLTGLFIRNLFKGRAITVNPILLFVMAFYGFVALFPLAVIFTEVFMGNFLALFALIIFGPIIAFGIALLVNVYFGIKMAIRRIKSL